MHTTLYITSYAFSFVVLSINFAHYSSLLAHNMVSLLQSSNWQRWIHHAPVCTSEGPACHWRASWKPTACAVCNKSNITSTACLQQASVYFTAGTWTLLCLLHTRLLCLLFCTHYTLCSLFFATGWWHGLFDSQLQLTTKVTQRSTAQLKKDHLASEEQVDPHHLCQCATGSAPKLCSSTDARPSKIKRPFGSMNPSLHIQKFRDQDH